MLQLDHFFAWVTVDGLELPEYGVEYSEDLLHATCWIASEENKNFFVHWRDSVRQRDSIGRTTVDGVRCGVSMGINQRGYRSHPSLERDSAQQSGVPTSAKKDRLFVFARLDLTDDDSCLSSAVSDELGEIKLEISYVKKGDKKKLKVVPFQTSDSKVHERTKILAQHHIRLGQTVAGERKATHSVKSIGNERVFLFKYRPLNFLKARGLVPRDNNASMSSKVVDLTEPDQVPDAKVYPLEKHVDILFYKVPRTTAQRLERDMSPADRVRIVKRESMKKEEDPPDIGIWGIKKQEPSNACKPEVKQDPFIKTEKDAGVKQEVEVKSQAKESNVPNIKVKQESQIKREMRVDKDIEIIDLTVE